MAATAIAPDEPVRKYGQIIGFAVKPIAPGDWVHEHNVAMHDFARDYRFAQDAKNDELLPPELRATFEGYLRPNGKTGTRNYIGMLTSVNCSATRGEVHRRGSQPLRPARRIIPASTASFPSCTAPAAAWRPKAKAGTCFAAPNGATPRIPISAPR